MKCFVGIFFIVILAISCKEIEKNRLTHLVNEWSGKVIYYPDSMCLTSCAVDTIVTKCEWEKSTYTILNYVDTVGCFSCKLQLPRWKAMIEEFDSLFPKKVTCLMVFYSKEKKQLIRLLKRERFNYFVYFDETDTLNRINKFLNEEGFQTFLINKDNKVMAIGNPVLNPSIKVLYENIITDKDVSKKEETPKTIVQFDNTSIDLGTFDWKQEIVGEFTLSNVGNIPFVIDDITVSCGCVVVEYSKEPIRSSDHLILKVKYTADHPERFNKTITVFCNTKDSPIQLKIAGNAK